MEKVVRVAPEAPGSSGGLGLHGWASARAWMGPLVPVSWTAGSIQPLSTRVGFPRKSSGINTCGYNLDKQQGGANTRSHRSGSEPR